MESVVDISREANTRMTVAIGSATRTNTTEGIIMEIIITLETVFKRGYIYGRDTKSARNVDGIMPKPKGFILSGSFIQKFSVFQSIMTIGSCQAPLPTMGLLEYRLEEEALKTVNWLLNIRQISLSYSNTVISSQRTIISP